MQSPASAAREAAIASALVAKAIQNRVTDLDFDFLELMPSLFSLAQCLHALPCAFEQAIDLQEAEQHNVGVIDLLSRHKPRMCTLGRGLAKSSSPSTGGGRSRVGLAVVAHHVRDVGVAGSNPATPTNT